MQGTFSRVWARALSVEPRKGRFFRPVDWTSFILATAIALGVYFFTLGPSVGLEDSGELATAGDHLGVPHPPGYPFWTMCSWVFCRVFSFVTYQGCPTPAWAISLLSSVFGALAAGCAAMLITRSATDWLTASGSAIGGERLQSAAIDQSANAKMALAAGLGGALVFAFSPVEWSQSTIVEIYSLNALFLMAVFLLSYRWMRRPGDGLLWVTAFVFGLGLTNYQVLAFAIVPLAIIILLRSIRLFRDAIAIAIPLGLTLLTLSTASLDRASAAMNENVIAKHLPPGDVRVVTRTYTDSARGRKVEIVTNDISKLTLSQLERLPPDRKVYDDLGRTRPGTRVQSIQSLENTPKSASTPSGALLWIAFLLTAAAPLAGKLSERWRNASSSAIDSNRLQSTTSDHSAAKIVLAVGGAGVVMAVLAATVFAGAVEWAKDYESPLAPLVEPRLYAFIGALLSLSCTLAAAAASMVQPGEGKWGFLSRKVRPWTAAAAVAGAVAIAIAYFVPAAGTAGYAGELHGFGMYCLFHILGIFALVLLTLWTPRGILFAIPAAAVQLTAMMLTVNGAMNGLTHPQSWWFFWPILWNLSLLALAFVTLPQGKSIAPAFLFGELGVAFYAYMPIVSDLRNPPMNWGYPRTWDGFKHALTRGQYEAIGFAETFAKLFTKDGIKEFAEQVGNYCKDLRLQFTLVAAALAFLPFTLWKLTVRTAKKVWRFDAFPVAAGIYAVMAFLVIVFSELLENVGDGEVPLRLDKVAILALALMALVGLVAIVKDILVACWRTVAQAITPIFSHRDAEQAEPQRRLCSSGWKPLLLVLCGSEASASLREKNEAVELQFGADGVLKEWLVASGVCFAVMSFMLIALAKTKGDIQDGFIQKVKFISSHGIFSLWIGYGLALGLAFAWKIAQKAIPAGKTALSKAAFAVLCVAAALTAAIPVYENYTNDRLVFEMGSAEQNGHTFGWQFGNYQLRGANAIREELSADEEPLPNPLYPPEMGKGAIFFGGTDPGRFVPTYMIYSANVRPDVYLITQNALADETYMSVERDLYGDEIWIPSRYDASEAFGIYVDEVESGKRPPNPGLSFVNGKVQVVGSSGVMEINGIITDMMFRKERLRRDFYVEESFAIPWMYPYLQPHGLIMQIAPDERPIPGKTVRADMDFWDWYRRRLMRDRAFRRDFPAQKAFSKLRAAIAGLYAKRGFREVAAQAFMEAYLLYPASPEAAFRYIQETLVPEGRWPQIMDILDYTDRVDPNNARTKPMRAIVSRYLENATTAKKLVDKERSGGKLSLQELLDLATLYAEDGRLGMARARISQALAQPGVDRSWPALYRIAEVQSAARMAGEAADTMAKAVQLAPANLPPAYRSAAASILHRGGKQTEALEQIDRVLVASPRDVRAWLLKARILATDGKQKESIEALRAAAAIDASATATTIESDPILKTIH